LCGVYPEVCARRYAAHHGLHASVFRAEVGLRILAGAVVRAAARFDRAAIPVLSVARGHWMRVVARITGGAGQADRATQALRDAAADGHGLGRIGPRAAGGAWAGPLWSGPLHDAALVAAMRDAAAGKRLARGPDVARLLALLAQEADAPPFWVVPDLLHKALGPPPRRDVLMARLRDAGFRAARTHLDAQGIRTDATLGDLKAAWKP
jgi:tRNA (guanine26-N2/guanine27-N2)-dimethyltransferase